MAQYYQFNFKMIAYIILFWFAVTGAEEEFKDYFGLHNLHLVGNVHESSPEDDTVEKVLVSNYRCVNCYYVNIMNLK